MTVYYLNLLIILVLAWPLCIHKPSKPKTALYLILTFGCMWFLAAFRYNIGYDYNTYLRIFGNIAQPGGIRAAIDSRFEIGFILVTKGMSYLVSSPAGIYGLYALLIFLPVMWYIYRYSKAPWLSVWLYVTLTFFYGTMNFIRQNMAASVLLLGYGLLREGKSLWIPMPQAIPLRKLPLLGGRNALPIPLFFAVVLAAAAFHQTALVMIPICIFAQIKLDKVMGMLYAGVGLLLFLCSEPILGLVTKYIYSYYNDSIYIQVGFENVIFLMLPVMLFGACLSLWPMWQKRDPDSRVQMNLILYNLIIWLFITRHFILERFSLFVYIFAVVGVPSALQCLLCPEEEYTRLTALREEETALKKKKGPLKETQGKIRQILQNISDHKKYYWSAVVALLLMTLVYNEFGAQVNGFHGVFPYQSLIEWVNKIP